MKFKTKWFTININTSLIIWLVAIGALIYLGANASTIVSLLESYIAR